MWHADFSVMSSSSLAESRSARRLVEGGSSQQSGGVGLIATAVLLGIILATGPLILGAARLWVELPLLLGLTVVVLIQGLRLMGRTGADAARQVDAIDLAVVLFTVYTVARWLTSPTEFFSRIEALDVFGYAAIFLTCRYGLANRAWALGLVFLLVALGVFETCFGYYLSNHLDWCPFGPLEQLHQHYAPRWVGTYGCPNHYGYMLVMGIGAALALGCFSKFPWPMRIVCFYVAGMMMVGVIESESRGSWLAFVVSTAALMIFGLRNGTVRWWVPVAASVALVISATAAFWLSPGVQGRLAEVQGLVENGTLNTYCRIELAEDALRIARDHPFFGTGPATFVFIHPRYQSSTFAYSAVLTHDDYLNCLDDYGVVGFGIAMFFVAAVTLKFWRPLRADQRWHDRVVVGAGIAAWAALLVHSLVDFNLHIPANAHLFFALTGLALGRLKARESAGHWSTISLAPLGRWLGVGLIVLGLAYGFEVARTALGDFAYEKAFAAALEVPTEDSINAAEDALKYDGGNAQDLVFLGDLYRYEGSRQGDMAGRVRYGDRALEIYREALKANGLDDTIGARMGMTFDFMGRYSEAFFCYETAVKAQPYNGEFWFALGNHFRERGILDRAEEAYVRSEGCPHGSEGSAEAIKELRALPVMQNVPVPGPDADPLASPAATEEPTTP